MLNITLKICAASLLITAGVYGQQKPIKKFGRSLEFTRCATTQYEALLKSKDPQRSSNAQFEQWLAPKIIAEKATRQASRDANTVVTIPVVIHVIHNGDAIGQNENIAEGQIMSQLTSLNQDFRKMLGTPGHNTNPVGADVEVEFCLAQRDEAGINTPGIIRYNLGSEEGWEMDDIEILKTQTQWDPGKYLNIWIVNSMTIGGVFQLAGYAQFPTASGLEGLDEGSPTTANTDGVVIAADCFGSEDIYPDGNYMPGKNKGRTASHEIGHFFGLRHIWGDDENCNGNDFCDDTPVAQTANQGCPSQGFDSCPGNLGTDMVQNYMDYTDDDCMNIFTLDQKERILAVLANSPRRASLTISNGCVPGIVYDNDGSLNIQGLSGNEGCEAAFNPQVVLKNNGHNVITSAAIAYGAEGQAAATYNWTGNLANGQEAIIDLPVFNPGIGQTTYSVSLTAVNGVPDQAPANDMKSQVVNVASVYNTSQVVITIKTDDFGDETLWALADSNENILATNADFNNIMNSDFLEDDTLYTYTIAVSDNQCYVFGIRDLYEDGMCCENGEGYYRIETLEGVVIAQGGEFGREVRHYFRLDSNLGTQDKDLANSDILLYPNPASTSITLAIPQQSALPGGYIIYNSLGQVIQSGDIKANTSVIDIAHFSTGVYIIKISGDTNSKALHFIKN